MGVLGWLLSHKLVCFFIVATTAFGVATIVLGVQNTNLRDEVDELKTQIGEATTTTTTTTTATTTTTTEVPTTTTEVPDTTTEPPADMTDYRLPTNVVPNHYDLYFYPDLVTGLFRGLVTITVEVSEVAETVKLHSKGLTINSVTIDGNPCADELDDVHELLIITPTSALSVGESIIEIDFDGDMKDRIVGLYMSSYKNEDNQDRYMATSKFEPTYARQAYPCFDEPNMKANFTVHLLKPNDAEYIALSNMRQVDETPEDNGVMINFEESVSMSTYLTCFIVSDFQYTNDTLDDGTELRVYSTPSQLAKTEYALEVGKKVIEFFITYFNIGFPLPKLDLAAIPDFVSGAMEHWGLVTFRETALLYSEEISSTANKQRVATVVSHELAHSWFGNLVTMDWWNDIWLNEGFASYIEYKGVANAHPTWQMMDQFLNEDLHPVLVLDATLGSHPIVQTVVTPDQITAIFDTISYNKGASVLRMLEDVVGEEKFKEGVTKYLNDHAYSNAVTQDLWDALQEVAELQIDITDFMNTWTVQMGYPVIDVASDDANYTLTQRRYLTDPDAVDTTETPYDYKWTIPVTYITSDNSQPQRVWFNYTEPSVSIPKPTTAPAWIKFNYNQIGYYRVNYLTTSDWTNLIDNVASLTIADRSHLIEETFRLAQSGTIDYEIPLNLAKYLSGELEYIPWTITATMLAQLKLYLSNSARYADLQRYVLDIVETAYESFTWTEDADDGHLRRRARLAVLDIACSFGHEACLNQANELFESWLSGDVSLSQDLRTLVYNYGMSSSSVPNWNALYVNFVAETDAQEKLKLMNGLAQIKDPTSLLRFIEIAKTEEVVRGQDYFTLLQYISANTVGNPIVWDYVRENWLALVDRFSLNDRTLGTLIPAITRRFTTQTKLEEIRAFFAKYPEAGAGAAARVQAIETVENNIMWVANYKANIEEYLASYTSAATTTTS